MTKFAPVSRTLRRVPERVVFRPRARQDLLDHALWLGEADPRTAERFLHAAEGAFVRLQEHPQIGSPRILAHPQLRELRMWPIPGFERILIFYLAQSSQVEVVRVLHAARDILSILRQEPGS